MILRMAFVAAVTGPVYWGFGAAAPPPQAEGPTVIMQRKLIHAQKVLEGVALGDFDRIGEHARELMDLSKRLEFGVLKTPQYALHTNAFRGAVDDMQKAAKAKNLDAAALAYVEMTMSCVKCHKYVREVRMTRKD
jgi:hypothetical protein